MNSSRFLAFYDAVLAIVMTILVLSFNIPDPDSWQNIARMIPGFVCYAASFFWLGLMWISSYMAWGKVEVVSERSLFYMLVSLFFSSFFPFATGLVGQDMNSVVAEVFYGVVVLCITVSNNALTGSINRDHSQPVLRTLFLLPARTTVIDVLIKIVGLLLCVFVWPPAMSVCIMLAVVVLTFRLFWDTRLPHLTGKKEAVKKALAAQEEEEGSKT